jgi:DUF4097 and DUF4098 domain-containing protein YvlB
MKKALILILVVMVCLVAYYTWSFADGGYTSGGATITDAVENIEINWTSGSVTVAYHDADTVILEETGDRPIEGDDRLRWKTDGTTLVVEYNTPALFRFFSPTKALTVTLPKDISLKKVRITATSADIIVPEMRAEEIALGSTSGDVNATVSAPTVAGESTSGNVTLKVNGKADRVKAGSTSGSLSLTLEQADRAEMGSTSGGICLEAEEVKEADLGSTSGNIRVKVKGFERMKIGATSGSVDAELAADPGFTAEISTTSGDFNSTMALTKEGEKWACGNGSAKLEIGTTSGNVRLSELK